MEIVGSSFDEHGILLHFYRVQCSILMRRYSMNWPKEARSFLISHFLHDSSLPTLVSQLCLVITLRTALVPLGCGILHLITSDSFDNSYPVQSFPFSASGMQSSDQLFLKLHIWERTYDIYLSVSGLLNIITPSSVYLAVDVRISLRVENYSIIYLYHISLMHSSSDGPALVIMNGAVMNMEIQAFLSSTSIPSVIHPHVGSIFSLGRNHRTVLQDDQTNLHSLSSPSLPAWLFIFFLMAILTGHDALWFGFVFNDTERFFDSFMLPILFLLRDFYSDHLPNKLFYM